MELKKLNRAELLELLAEQTKRADELEVRLKAAEEELKNRRIAIDESGSIAEAALKINDIFRKADIVAAQYLDEVKQMQSKQKELCAQMEDESRRNAAEIIRQAEENAREMERAANDYYKRIVVQAKAADNKDKDF